MVARKPVGTRQAIEAYVFHLEKLLEEYDLAVQQIDKVELAIKEELPNIPFADKLLNFKGISEISLAGIL
uniref:hypothetical protein n=1 Tax=Cytobacillus oceanisediminis TaxID=665099 RepID=UPI003736B61F